MAANAHLKWQPMPFGADGTGCHAFKTVRSVEGSARLLLDASKPHFGKVLPKFRLLRNCWNVLVLDIAFCRGTLQSINLMVSANASPADRLELFAAVFARRGASALRDARADCGDLAGRHPVDGRADGDHRDAPRGPPGDPEGLPGSRNCWVLTQYCSPLKLVKRLSRNRA